jgi:hypothetical protein
MKRYSVITVILSLAFAMSAYAADWKGLGLEVLDKKEGEGAYEYKLKDAGGIEFVIQSEKEISDALVKRAIDMKGTLTSREIFKVKEIKFTILPNSIDAAIVPSEFTYSGTDILPYLPSTIIFSLSDKLEYSFRIVKDNIFMRIKGEYIDDKELGEKVLEGINNPVGFVRKRDPEYFLSRINEMEDSLKRLTSENGKLRNAVMTWHNTFLGFGSSPIEQKKVDRVLELRKQRPDIKKDEIKATMEKEGNPISGKELDLIFATYFNEFQ